MILINATPKEKSIFVKTALGIEKLKKIDAPIHYTTDTLYSQTFDTGEIEFSLQVLDSKKVKWMFEPPIVEGTLYLVESEVLLLATHRDDYVTPEIYQMTDDNVKPGDRTLTFLAGISFRP